MGISFFQVSDSKVLLSTLIIWATCSFISGLDRQEMIFVYLLTVPLCIVLIGIQGCPELELTAILCLCLLLSGLVRTLYTPLNDMSSDPALQHILVQSNSIQGCLSSDSKFINGSKQEFQIKVEKITNFSKELSFSAEFETKVIIYNQNRYFSGEWVDLSGQFILFDAKPKSDGGSGKSNLVYYASDITLRQRGFSVYRLALGMRKSCIEYIYHQFSEIPHEASELSTALLLGRKEDPSNPIIQLFREAGCAHILALSGMHLQVISGLIFWIVSWVLGPRKSKIVTSLSIILFVWIAGGKPSLIRSMIMFVIIANRRKKDLLNTDFLLSSLGLTIAFQALIFPVSCSGPGYFLSYSAILGIVVFSGRISTLLPGILPAPIRSALSASLAAFTVSSPFLVHYFGELYPIGIVASIPLTILVTLYMISSMILLLPFFTKEILLFLRKILSFEYRVIERVSMFFSKTPVIAVERDTIINAFLLSAGFVLLTVFISIEYSIYKQRGRLSTQYKTK